MECRESLISVRKEGEIQYPDSISAVFIAVAAPTGINAPCGPRSKVSAGRGRAWGQAVIMLQF